MSCRRRAFAIIVSIQPLIDFVFSSFIFKFSNACFTVGKTASALDPYVTCALYICVRDDIKSLDVNGNGIVNMRDITEIILDFNAMEGDGRYKP
jgi:hypothetical protein